MHTFFMNADNLFRFDQNIERMEVVRGGASALFGSNTPGAIINFINKIGGDRFGGTTRITGGTQEYARYDLNAGGPMGEDWRFNVGGFYRYDHGVRDPGFTGIRGGQLKANVTRQLDNGYLRASVKHINDRNQFILPLPFTNAEDPEYVSGFSNYGSMSTPEGLDLQVPTPDGPRTTIARPGSIQTTALTPAAAGRFAGRGRDVPCIGCTPCGKRMVDPACRTALAGASEAARQRLRALCFVGVQSPSVTTTGA